MQGNTRRRVPFAVTLILLLSLCALLVNQAHLPPPKGQAQNLAPPPSIATLKLQSLGEPIFSAHLLMLYLQAFDNQPGVSLPFAALPYNIVTEWLTRALALDPSGGYPLMLASQMYAQVPDEKKQRQMLDFTFRQFFSDPNTRWRWLAHAAIIAKHRLHDLPLALGYANAIATHATGEDVPHWAQQMPIFILEDMGELESAKIMLGALLANGTITDPHEIHFLSERLKALQEKTR